MEDKKVPQANQPKPSCTQIDKRPNWSDLYWSSLTLWCRRCCKSWSSPDQLDRALCRWMQCTSNDDLFPSWEDPQSTRRWDCQRGLWQRRPSRPQTALLSMTVNSEDYSVKCWRILVWKAHGLLASDLYCRWWCWCGLRWTPIRIHSLSKFCIVLPPLIQWDRCWWWMAHLPLYFNWVWVYKCSLASKTITSTDQSNGNTSLLCHL